MVDQDTSKTVHVFGPHKDLAIPQPTCLIYGEHNAGVSLGDGCFLGEAASRDGRIQGAKNIFARGDYR